MQKSTLKPFLFAVFVGCCLALPVFAIAESGSTDYSDYEDYYTERVIVHEQIGPWEPMINRVWPDVQHRILVIHIDGVLLTGTDTACQLFAQMVKDLTRNDWLVLIANDGWFPAERRLIDHAYAIELTQPF